MSKLIKGSALIRVFLCGVTLTCLVVPVAKPLYAQVGATPTITPTNAQKEDSLREKLIVAAVDKGLLALVVLVAGFWLNKALERVKSSYALKSEMEKLRDARQLDFMERQLSEFYWPIYVRLEYDTAVWRRILDKKQTSDVVDQRIGAAIEEKFIIPNHDEIVDIIRSKIHLMKDDPPTFQAMLGFIRHVAVYKAMRAAGIEEKFPDELGEPWPKEFFPLGLRRQPKTYKLRTIWQCVPRATAS